MKKIVVLFNPSSAKGRALKQKETITRLLANGGMHMDFIVTESEDHLRNLAAAAAKTPGQYDAIVGVGGDTTFNIIATEILKYKHDAKNAPAPAVGMIGTGSANDIIRGLGLETIATACQAIINGDIKKMDVCCVSIYKNVQPFQPQPEPETLFFLGTLSLGLGVTVNRYVEDFRQRRKILAKWKPCDQLLPALYAIYDSFAKKKIPLRVNMEYGDLVSGEKIKLPVEFSLLVLLNTPFYANGLQLGQANGLFDGVLDCCIIDTKTFFKTFREGLRILRRKHTQTNNERVLRSTWYKISSPESMDIQVDGEIIAGIREMEVSMIPGGLDVFSACFNRP